jgi:hypothetical protein
MINLGSMRTRVDPPQRRSSPLVRFKQRTPAGAAHEEHYGIFLGTNQSKRVTLAGHGHVPHKPADQRDRKRKVLSDGGCDTS